MEMKTFGKNLKRERKLAGLTQQQLADKLGIKQQQLSEWECDRVEPTLYNIVALLDALGVSFEDLIDGIQK
ncbi:MAG: helix-turn-helix transcriptional regulator [Clostridia bacterium]|nr:helix-turn-helix transcriptional regulator [Clostridia bacterium]MBR2485540.1 helix-turn-helix transcriptional regulator [Clostridia bacterium]